MTETKDADRVWLRMLRLMTRIKVAMTERLKEISLSPAQLDRSEERRVGKEC